MSRDRRKLKAFQLTDELAVMTYCHTNDFPRDEWFGLRSQMRRAAVSVPANIVEGAARESGRDYLNFLNIAFASLRELGFLIGHAQRLQYLADDRALALHERQAEAARVLSGLIAALKQKEVARS